MSTPNFSPAKALDPGLNIIHPDAVLIQKNIDPENNRTWNGVVRIETKLENHITLEDILGEEAGPLHDIWFGTRSSIAQLGTFISMVRDPDTGRPHMETKNNEVEAEVLGINYSGYPVEIQEGADVGRFVRMVGRPLKESDVHDLLAKCEEQGKPLYQHNGEPPQITPHGQVILKPREFGTDDHGHALGREFRVQKSPTIEPPYTFGPDSRNNAALDTHMVRTRLDLDKILYALEAPLESIELCNRQFLLTETDRMIMPYDHAGLLDVQSAVQIMGESGHLNSPTIDPGFGNKDNKSPDSNKQGAPLRLEISHLDPNSKSLADLRIYMNLFRAHVIRAARS